MKKLNPSFTFFLFLLLLFTSILNAQVNRFDATPSYASFSAKDLNAEGKDIRQNELSITPVDGAIALLLASGVFCGCKKVRDRQVEFQRSQKELN